LEYPMIIFHRCIAHERHQLTSYIKEREQMVQEKANVRNVVRIEDGYIGREKYTRLDKNEKSTPLKDGHLRLLREYIISETITAYPEPEPLYEKLSVFLGVDTSELYLTTGSDLGIKAVFEVFIEKHSKILMHSPCYAMFDIYRKLFGAKKTEVPFNRDLSLDLGYYCGKITKEISLVVLENPNGFVGTSFDIPDVVEVIKKASENGSLVVIDEAYFHFCNSTVANYINQFDNLIISRTFSKAFSMAGVRLGYLMANKNLIQQLRKFKPMHEVTNPAVAIGCFILDHMEILEERVAENRRVMEYFVDRCADKGIEVIPTDANFVLLRLPGGIDGAVFQNKMRERGMLVRRPFAQDFLKGLVRIGMGEKEQMDRLLEAMEDLIQVCLETQPIK